MNENAYSPGDTDLVSQAGTHGEGLGLVAGERRSLRANLLLLNPSDQSLVEGVKPLGEFRTLPTVGLGLCRLEGVEVEPPCL